MARADLQTFLQDRLVALDPTIDLSPGSPAQTKFILPVMTYLGTDPFETDIDAFIIDRFSQEFPDIYAGDPGALRDGFINPLRVVLEPFKRETAIVRKNQSLVDPTVLSDDDADALVANFFDSRDPGGYAVGSVRLYFANPTDTRISVANRVWSRGNLNFFPTNPVTISADSMAFNRDGTFFYMDVPLRAEAQGTQYNIDYDQLAGIDGVPNVIKLANLSPFDGGTERQDTVSFVTSAEGSLTERSLLTRRGATARLGSVFKGAIRSVQVAGAKDPEMQRDIIVAASPGHAWITGTVELYTNVAYVRARTIEGDLSAVPQTGDTLYFYLSVSSYGGVLQPRRFVRVQVQELLFGPSASSGAYQSGYFVRWADVDGNLDITFGKNNVAGFLATLPLSFEGGFSKKGSVRVTSLPDVGPVDLTVDNGAIHVFGRTDIYVRPSTQDTSKAVLNGVYDLGKIGSTTQNPHFSLERLSLSTSSGSNQVHDLDPAFDFIQAGVENGNLLSIEAGADAGYYSVLKVSASTLYLNHQLTTASPVNGIRYRVLKDVRIDLFETRAIRFPFGDVTQRDLQTTIGSAEVTLSTNDLLLFGTQAGDTLRILEGTDAGDYTIQSFDPALGGQGIILDRKLSATNYNLPFEVFASLDSVRRPLVRVRELLLLDSTLQSTGITVPPADPVAVIPTGPFTSAKVLGRSQLASGYVLPDLASLAPALSQAAPSGDRRYSMGFDIPDGPYIPVLFPDGTYAELDLRSDSQGKTSYFLSTSETFDETTNYPPIDPKTGDCLSLKNGPNAGSYLIRAVHKFKYKVSTSASAFVYFIQIYGTFPVDPLKQIITFLQQHGQPTGLSGLTFPIAFPSFFQTWYAGLGEALASALSGSGLTGVELQPIVEAMNGCQYEWGLPARGVLRSYFREPTLFEEKTCEADVVTQWAFKTATGALMKFRPDPQRYQQYELVPARLTSDAGPTDYPRDLDAEGPGPVFTDVSRASIFAMGIHAGDVLSVHQELFVYGTKYKQAVVKTGSGSQQLIAPAAAGTVFTSGMIGNLLFVEEGGDVGGYVITRVIDGQNVLVDRVLQNSTAAVAKQGSGASCYYDAGGTYFLNQNVVVSSPGTWDIYDVGSYITIFGVDYRWMGSFAILGVSSDGAAVSVQAPTTTRFASVGVETTVRWLTTAAPSTTPSALVRADPPPGAVPTGTNLVGAVPIRIYEAVPVDFPFTSVLDDASNSGGSVSGTVRDGVRQPYRIFRPNVRRVTPTEMSGNQDGFLYFFDTEVVSLSPSDQSNLSAGSYLTTDEDTYDSIGYRHIVADPSFTFSMREEGFLDLPLSVLPVGSADSEDNLVRLVGAPLQIAYERANLVSLVQQFIDSLDDRVLAAGILARHFLPAYLSYDAAYSGGDDAGTIAKDIISYINQLPVETSADVSEIQKIIDSHGGDPATPTKLSATIYDWSRKLWVEFSEDQLGGSAPADTAVPYNGSPRVTCFTAGQDVSGLTDVPPGERINLIRR